MALRVLAVDGSFVQNGILFPIQSCSILLTMSAKTELFRYLTDRIRIQDHVRLHGAHKTRIFAAPCVDIDSHLHEPSQYDVEGIMASCVLGTLPHTSPEYSVTIT